MDENARGKGKDMTEVSGQNPETQLLDKYRGGDVEALGILVEKYRKPLFAFIGNMTRSHAEADEVFQEVWFKAIRKLALYRDKNFGGWLMRIAHNTVIDRARKLKNECSLDSGSEGGNGGSLGSVLPAPGQDPSAHTAAGELGKRISAAVAALPHEQKAVFLMRIEMDLPFKEIAGIQKVSINTALARMHYAVGKLRTLLKNDYEALAAQRLEQERPI